MSGGARRFESRTGARQGCKVGSLIFNAAYSIPFDIFQWKLQKASIALRLRVPSGASWLPPDADNDDYHFVMDVTSVDDERAALTSPPAKSLRDAVDILMETLLNVFDNCHLQLSRGLARQKPSCSSEVMAPPPLASLSDYLMVSWACLYRSSASTSRCAS